MDKNAWMKAAAIMATVLIVGACATGGQKKPSPAPAPVALPQPAPPPEPPKFVPPPIPEKTDEDRVRERIMENEAYIRYLYNKHSKIHPGLEGKVVVNICIDDFGTVTACTISSSTVANKNLENELVKYIKTLKFDTIKFGELEVVYPFVFSPKER